MSGRPIIAMATLSFRLLPPEYVEALRPAYSTRSICFFWGVGRVWCLFREGGGEFRIYTTRLIAASTL